MKYSAVYPPGMEPNSLYIALLLRLDGNTPDYLVVYYHIMDDNSGSMTTGYLSTPVGAPTAVLADGYDKIDELHFDDGPLPSCSLLVFDGETIVQQLSDDKFSIKSACGVAVEGTRLDLGDYDVYVGADDTPVCIMPRGVTVPPLRRAVFACQVIERNRDPEVDLIYRPECEDSRALVDELMAAVQGLPCSYPMP